MLKKILSIFIVLMLFTTLQAEDKKVGKFLGAKDTTMPSWFSDSFLDIQEDIETLASENKRLILFVHQANCPYCNLFVTKNLADNTMKNKIINYFGVTDINMFGDREVTDIDGTTLTEKEFARKYNVQFTPTFMFFNEKGKQILRLNGYKTIKQFNLALGYVRNKRERLMTYQQYLEQDKISTHGTNLIAEPDLFKDSKNFMKDKTSKNFAVFFESRECTQCEKLHDYTLKNKTTRELLKKLDLFQVDMNSTKSIVNSQNLVTKVKDWTTELNITNTPTIVFFDEKGEEIIRIDSAFKDFHFQSIIDYVVSDSFKEEKEFQRYLTKRANAIREKGIDVNIWE